MTFGYLSIRNFEKIIKIKTKQELSNMAKK